jgi:hypothetical protein
MFKIKDRVKILSNAPYVGNIGTVVSVDDRFVGKDDRLYVKLDYRQDTVCFWPSELEAFS